MHSDLTFGMENGLEQVCKPDLASRMFHPPCYLILESTSSIWDSTYHFSPLAD